MLFQKYFRDNLGVNHNYISKACHFQRKNKCMWLWLEAIRCTLTEPKFNRSQLGYTTNVPETLIYVSDATKYCMLLIVIYGYYSPNIDPCLLLIKRH